MSNFLCAKTKELDTRAALLEFAYEFRTMAKHLERHLSGGRGAQPRASPDQVRGPFPRRC
jgi:hypothetical protein